MYVYILYPYMQRCAHVRVHEYTHMHAYLIYVRIYTSTCIHMYVYITHTTTPEDIPKHHVQIQSCPSVLGRLAPYQGLLLLASEALAAVGPPTFEALRLDLSLQLLLLGCRWRLHMSLGVYQSSHDVRG